MTALDRQGWILVGFAVLFFTALVVSACGWLLMWRTRRPHASEDPARPHPPQDPAGESGEDVEEAPSLPPGNPLR